MIKSENIQEYTIANEIEEWKVDVWQPEERFQDVWALDDDTIRNIKINPDEIYKGAIWGNTKTEKFT